MATSQLAVASGLDFVNPQPAGPVPERRALANAPMIAACAITRNIAPFFGGWVPIPSKMNLSQGRCD
jgi:hypothetical protein